MKKIYFLSIIMLFSMCRTPYGNLLFNEEDKKEITEKRIEKIKEEDRLPNEEDVIDLPTYAQVRDDFRSVSENTKKKYLIGMKAADDNYSVIILTKGYKGEDLIVKNDDRTYYKGMTMTDLKTGIAKSIRVDNTKNFGIQDSYTEKELVIESYHAKMFKFIYIMKNNGDKTVPFKVTFSNTLRPVQ